MTRKVKWFISMFGDSLIGKKVIHDHQVYRITGVDFIDNIIYGKSTVNPEWKYLWYKNAEIDIDIQVTNSENKTPFHLLDLDFAAAMCENWQAGIKNGRQPNDWKEIEPTPQNIEMQEAKLLRHLRDARNADFKNDRKKHLAAIACNANILWSMECQK